LTKIYEEFIRGRVLDLLQVSRERTLKGECVLVLEGSSKEELAMSQEEVLERLESMLQAGARLKDAAGLLAKESGWSSSDIYKLGLKLRGTND
jgi:16S rRNA (cytidine1402-2'-O)-methyltransferase